jgi:hypothetical protein
VTITVMPVRKGQLETLLYRGFHINTFTEWHSRKRGGTTFGYEVVDLDDVPLVARGDFPGPVDGFRIDGWAFDEARNYVDDILTMDEEDL